MYAIKFHVMPVNKGAYIRYKEIDRCLRSSKNYTWKDLHDSVSNKVSETYSSIKSVSLRTLKYDLEFMKNEYLIELDEELFKKRPAIIKYKNATFSISKEVSDEDIKKIKESISYLETFSRSKNFKSINAIVGSLKGEIDLFQNKRTKIDFAENIFQSGFELLNQLSDSIINKEVIKIKYKTKSGKVSEKIINPHYLKQSKTLRWYLYGEISNTVIDNNMHKDYPKIYALDRIKKIKYMPNIQYAETSIDYENYFEDAYDHTVLRGRKPKKIIFYVEKNLLSILDTNPPHPSYKKFKKDSIIKIKINNEDVVYIKREMELIVCKGLKGEFLKNSHKIIVKEPKSLANFIKREHVKALESYNVQL